ncbi:transporter [Clostridia bacterium]|nr:transporter [Clostridia bacterium]
MAKWLKAAGVCGSLAGLYIGAGFISGAEVSNFFAKFGAAGFVGLVLSAGLFFVSVYKTLSICRIKKISSYEDFGREVFGKLAVFAELGTAVFLLVLFATMLAAISAFCGEVFGVKGLYGAIIGAVICFSVFTRGSKGFLTLNTALLPVMIIGIIVICAAGFGFSIGAVSFARPYWILSAAAYAAYNIAAVIPVVTTFEDLDEHTIKYSSLSASVILLVLGGLIAATLCANPGITAQIPMLYIAASHKFTYMFYIITLFLAVMTTAVGSGYAFIHWISNKIAVKNSNNRSVLLWYVQCAFVTLVALRLSLFGFSAFVSKVYPAFGLLGVLQIVCIFRYNIKKD